MAPRGENKQPANLLRESLSANAALRDSVASCPDPEILASYFDRSLGADETDRLELHLSHCSNCRDQLAAMHRVDEPGTADAQTSRPSPWGGFWNWRWLAPVAAALIVAGVWMARRPVPKSGSEQHALVAMSQPQTAPLSPPASARNYQRDAGPAPSAASEQKARKQASRQFSAADKLSSENPQPTPQGNRKTKDEESDLANNRNAIGGVADLKKQNEPQPAAPSQARGEAGGRGAIVAGAIEPSQLRANAAPAAQPMATVAGASVESAKSATDTEENSIGPQAGTVETRSNQPSAAARLSTERSPETVQTQSKALALQAVERRSGIRVIKTPDPKVLWRIAERGFVERSTDAGATWKGELPSMNAQLTAGFAPSADICWVIGRDGAIFLTTNANDWKRIQPPVDDADFTAIAAQDAFSATVTTADGRRFVTTDGGAHWNPGQ